MSTPGSGAADGAGGAAEAAEHFGGASHGLGRVVAHRGECVRGRREALARQWALAFVEGYQGADARLISAQSTGGEEDPSGEHRPTVRPEDEERAA